MNKKYQAFIDIVNVLNKNNITYNEFQDVINLTKVHVKQMREMKEYNSSPDYYNHKKSLDAGNIIIECVTT